MYALVILDRGMNPREMVRGKDSQEGKMSLKTKGKKYAPNLFAIFDRNLLPSKKSVEICSLGVVSPTKGMRVHTTVARGLLILSQQTTPGPSNLNRKSVFEYFDDFWR